MERSDAWNKKTGAHASTLEMELMHEAAKQGAMHHFSSERGPAAASVCVRFPGNPMNSVLIRKPRAGNSEKPGPAAAPVCVRIPGNPMKSVSVRKPRAGNSEKPGPAAFPVCVRFPGNPMKSVSVRKPRAGNSEKPGPARPIKKAGGCRLTLVL